MMSNPAERLQWARAAQANWAAMAFRERVAHLKRFRHALLDETEQILETVRQELGKPDMDTLGGDVTITLEQMLYYERRAESMLRPRSLPGRWPFLHGTRTREIYEPHGVVLVIAPWNYPVQLSLVPAITALYAGNAVLCKCSEHASATSAVLQKIATKAGLPADLLQFSWGPGEEASALLDAGPDFVFFTGSSGNGRKVAEQAGRMLIPTAMELGGKDAAVVFASCPFERTVNGLVYGAFSNSGQVCVSAKRIYVEDTLFERFCTAFAARARTLRMGEDIGPLRVLPMKERLGEQVEDARTKGALGLAAEDECSAGPFGDGETGPILLQGVPTAASLLQAESFGPVTCVAAFKDEAEAITLANSSVFGLGASVWTSDAAQAERFAKAVRAGSCVVNDVIRHVSHPGAAFGGVGASGYGRYHGREGLRTFSRIKTVMVVAGNAPTQINWFPFSRKTGEQLRALLRFRHGGGSLGKRVVEMIRALLGAAK